MFPAFNLRNASEFNEASLDETPENKILTVDCASQRIAWSFNIR